MSQRTQPPATVLVRRMRRQLAEARATIARQRRWLRGIKQFAPDEICYDEFAYKRLIDSYRDAARKALAKP